MAMRRPSCESATYGAGGRVIEVTDSGRGHPPKVQSPGIGLANVLQRLRLIYGEEEVELTAARIDDGRFRVCLAFPLELA